MPQLKTIFQAGAWFIAADVSFRGILIEVFEDLLLLEHIAGLLRRRIIILINSASMYKHNANFTHTFSASNFPPFEVEVDRNKLEQSR